MKMFIYAIRDSKTGFLSLTLEQNHDSAVRNFAHACMNTQSLFFTHPEDYSLYCLGSYDCSNGRILPVDVVEHLVDATSFVKGED